MTEQQRMRILSLAKDLRNIAAPVGPLHSYWDVISDLEAFASGRATILRKTAEEWIAYAEELLTPNGGELCVTPDPLRKGTK